MAINVERFRRIDQRLTREESLLSMLVWEGTADTSCGTTRCIAGWAIFDEIGADLFDHEFHPSAEVRDLALRLGVRYVDDFAGIACILLGLPECLRDVFYAGNDVGRAFVKAAADGASKDALGAILYRDSD